MNIGKEFLVWLEKQSKRDEPIGDLASDFISDRKRRPINTFEDLYARVSWVSNSLAMDALKDAWREFTDETFPIDEKESKECSEHGEFDCNDCEDLW
jgi:hypothetical protein